MTVAASNEAVSHTLPVRTLVGLGVLVHLLFVGSIFDIHFQSPIVTGLAPVQVTTVDSSPPAKRLVIFVADGLRADKFYEMVAVDSEDPEGPKEPRAPFLHSVAQHSGRWGLSHARPPTESRPGHVAILAGLYEDPSAITKGWQANPVEFDHILNRSSAAWAMGSPDIVPLFTKGIPHARGATYGHHLQDFSSAYLAMLDEWAFDRCTDLLRRAGFRGGSTPAQRHEGGEEGRDPWEGEGEGAELAAKLHQDGVVIFLHLLGLDSNGHAHRPSSPQYEENVRIVDNGVERVAAEVAEFFGDGRTAFVFTADHGMSNKGAHGDGDPANTETPLVVWGAGAASASTVSEEMRGLENHTHIDGCSAVGVTQPEWQLDAATRTDVDQADIAPIFTTLLGLPPPVNSVGMLPLSYLDMSRPSMAAALITNAEQLLSQVARKSEWAAQRCISACVGFRPYAALLRAPEDLAALKRKLHALGPSRGDAAQTHELIAEARQLAQHALDGLDYLHTYDRPLLMAVIVAAYLGWIAFLLMHLLQAFPPAPAVHAALRAQDGARAGVGPERGAAGAVLVAVVLLLLSRGAPAFYYAYFALPVALWAEVLRGRAAFLESLRHLASHCEVLQRPRRQRRARPARVRPARGAAPEAACARVRVPDAQYEYAVITTAPNGASAGHGGGVGLLPRVHGRAAGGARVRVYIP